MGAITATAFQNYFVFDRERIKASEGAFSKELSLLDPLPRSNAIELAASNWDRIEGYYVDRTLARTLCLEKVKICFEKIKEKHLENGVFSLWGFPPPFEEEQALEAAFCKRVFKRICTEKQKEIPNPYSEDTEEEAFKKRRWDFELKTLKEPPREFLFRDEKRKWFLQREALALREIEWKLERHSDNPERALAAIAYIESKEREIEEKTRKARKTALGALFISLTVVSAFATFCYQLQRRRLNGNWRDFKI